MNAYLDNMASTPLDPRVVDHVAAQGERVNGNPHALLHFPGREAALVVSAAREQVAAALAVRSEEIIFTPSATISDNLAVIGVARARVRKGRHIVVSAIEHPAVLLAARHLAEEEGFELDVVPVGPSGVIEPMDVFSRLRPDTTLVSVMSVNNELGTIQPIAAIADGLKDTQVFFHTDASQAPGRIPLDFAKLVDLMTLSSHKIYGPRGAAALYVRRRRDIRIKPLFFGGGQENGLCSGTVNTAAVCGFGRAMELADECRLQDCERIRALSDILLSGLASAIPGASPVGDRDRSVPHCVSVRIEGVAGETFVSRMARAGVAVSLGSACHGDPAEPSHVLTAIGMAPAEARRTIRFGLGRFTTMQEIEYTLKQAGLIASELL